VPHAGGMSNDRTPFSPAAYSLSTADQLRRQRQPSQVLGTVGRILLITAAVVLVLGGLALAGFIVLLVVGLNSAASNK
jgi:hypothetical protein